MTKPNPLDRSLHRPAARPPAEPVQDDAVIGRAFKWSLAVLFALALCGAAVWAAVALRPGEAAVEQGDLSVARPRARPEATPPVVPLVEIAAEAGLDFVHETGAAGAKLLPETMGGGAGFFDYDSDGDPDLLMVNSSRWPSDGPAGEPAITRLYENDGTGQFTDVTAGSGLDVNLYGMGCAFGDYDADGDPDVYLTAVGSNKLFRNDGGGRFVDVTEDTGTAGPPGAWTTAAAWFDADADGDLDLLALNYVEWNREYDAAQPFVLTGDERAYGRPQAFGGTVPLLYINKGDGTFTEGAKAAGLHVMNPATGEPLAKSLGLALFDADADGDLDIFVANDTVRNFLFLNQSADGSPGTYIEGGTAAGGGVRRERGGPRGDGGGRDAAPKRGRRGRRRGELFDRDDGVIRLRGGGRGVRGRGRRQRPRAADPAGTDVRRLIHRLRPRRPPGPAVRQRAPRNRHQPRSTGRHLRPSPAAVLERRPRRRHGVFAGRPRAGRRRVLRAGRRPGRGEPPTSTSTATRTCSSRPSAAARGCFATTRPSAGIGCGSW